MSGSLQARSSNTALLRTAHRVAPAGVEVVDSFSVGAVAPFNPDIERDGPAPATVLQWRCKWPPPAGCSSPVLSMPTAFPVR